MAGQAAGAAVVLDTELSLWGGFNPETGQVSDVHHPQHGVSLSGRVVLMPHGRGSSSSSSVFLEAVRLETIPAAFVLLERDDIVVLGAIVAQHLYSVTVPIAVIHHSLYDRVRTGDEVQIAAGAIITTRDAQVVLEWPRSIRGRR